MIDCNANLGLIAVIVALQAYAFEHDGGLPTNLQELVPKYIEEIPLATFHQEQIRYSPVEGKVWSVGEDVHEDYDDVVRTIPGFENGRVIFKNQASSSAVNN